MKQNKITTKAHLFILFFAGGLLLNQVATAQKELMPSRDSNGKFGYGYVDSYGKFSFTVTPKYDSAIKFDYGNILTRVMLNKKWGFISNKGKETIPLIYDDAMPFNDDLAGVKQNGKWGFISPKGNEILPFKYEEVKYFVKGYATVMLNGKWGIIDKAGKEIMPFVFNQPYELAIYHEKNVIMAYLGIVPNYKYGYIHSNGKEIIPFNFSTTNEAELAYKNSFYTYMEKNKKSIKSKADEQEAQKEFLRKESEAINHEFVIGDYNSQNQTFLLKSIVYGNFTVAVPKNEAGTFRENYTFNPDATISEYIDNVFSLTTVGFTVRNKTYTGTPE